jgi:hypothetical protein
MATQRQIAANRRNAKHSTGPRSETGKGISRRNAQSHGLTAHTLLLLDGKDHNQFSEMQQAVFDQFKPQTALEEYLVGALTATIWRLRRAAGFEAALLKWTKYDLQHPDTDPLDFTLDISHSLIGRTEEDAEDIEEDQKPQFFGRVLDAALTNDLFAKISRHESHLMRQIERVLDQLRRLKGEQPVAPS